MLEAAGFQVVVPGRLLCCGRPLYDYGMLDLAKRCCAQILDGAAPQIARRSRRRPRAELRVGLPRRAAPICSRTTRTPGVCAKQTFLLSEFLEQQARTTTRRAPAQGAGPRPLPPQGGAQDGRRAGAAGTSWASTPISPTPAAAAWRALSASRRDEVRCLDQRGERVLLPAVRAGRPRTPSSSPTASVAASRFVRAATVAHCISRRYSACPAARRAAGAGPREQHAPDPGPGQWHTRPAPRDGRRQRRRQQHLAAGRRLGAKHGGDERAISTVRRTLHGINWRAASRSSRPSPRSCATRASTSLT